MQFYHDFFTFILNNAYSIAVACLAVALALLVKRQVKTFLWKHRLRCAVDTFRRSESKKWQQIKASRVDNFEQITSLDFETLRPRLARGELRAVDVLRAYQSAAVEVNKSTNSVTEFINGAECKARDLDESTHRGPLHGIPVSVKECVFVEGSEATEGHAQWLGKFTNHRTAAIVRFVERLGAIPFVKTNLPQAMMSFDSRNAIYGLCVHPSHPDRSPGGSTSGEGVLVGAKASILGIGSDGGGSLRIPAAWCGCCTLKPTSHRMLHGPTYPSQLTSPRANVRDFLAMGFLSRDVATLVEVHKLMYSKDTFANFKDCGLAPIPFRSEEFSSKKPLRIGFCYSDEVVETVPAIKRAIDEAKSALEAKGHTLVPWKMPRSREAFIMYLRIMTVDGTIDVIKAIEDDLDICFQNKMSIRTSKWPAWFKRSIALVAKPFIGDLPAEILRSLKVGSHPHDSNIEYQRFLAYKRQFLASFTQFDAVIYPSFPSPALPYNAPRDTLAAISYTALFNLLDIPAGVVPVTRVSDKDEAAMATYPTGKDLFHKAISKGMSHGSVGLPVAVQLLAPQYHEEVILRLMSEIEHSAKFQ